MGADLLLFNSQFSKVTIERDSNTAIVHWKQQANADEFWEASYHVMQYIALGNTHYCVFKHENGIKIPSEHRLWLKYIAMPEAQRYGVKRLATLTKDALPWRAAHNLHDMLFGSRSLPHRCFSEQDAMYQWLYRLKP